MDYLCLAIPHICETIFQHLDDKSLATCRLINKTWKKCVDNEKTVWHRIIDKLLPSSKDETWIPIMESIPSDILKEIGKSILHNFQVSRKEIVTEDIYDKCCPTWWVISYTWFPVAILT